jgi:hypothetical protein
LRERRFRRTIKHHPGRPPDRGGASLRAKEGSMKKFGIAVLAAVVGLSLIGVMASLVFLVSRVLFGTGAH